MSTEDLRTAPLAFALGFASYSYLAQALLLFERPPAWLVLAAAGAGIVLGRRPLRVWATKVRTSRLASTATSGWMAGALALGCLAYLGLHALECMTPPRLGDALRAYMVTARWLYEHAFLPCPWNLTYGSMPHNTEAIFALSFAFGTDLVAKMIDGLMGVAFLAGLIELAARFAPPRLALIAGIGLAVMPGFYKLMGGGKIDIATGFVLFESLALLVSARGRPSGARERVLLSVLLLGTACAQKYVAWLFAPVHLVATAHVTLATLRTRHERIGLALASFAVMLACVAPTCIKNLVWTGNPVAPFAGELFGSSAAFLPPHHEPTASMTNQELAVLPYTLFFGFERHYWYGWLPLLLLVGLPAFAYFHRRASSDAAFLAFVALADILLWAVLAGRNWLVIRFLLPQIAWLLAVAAAGLASLWPRPVVRGLLTGGALLLLLVQGVYMGRYCAPSWRFVLGYEDRAEWQDRMAPERAYGPLQALASELGPSRRVYLASAHLLYNLPAEHLPHTNTEVERLTFERLSPADRVRWLRDQGFAFFFLPANAGLDAPAGLSPFSVSEPRPGMRHTTYAVPPP